MRGNFFAREFAIDTAFFGYLRLTRLLDSSFGILNEAEVMT